MLLKGFFLLSSEKPLDDLITSRSGKRNTLLACRVNVAVLEMSFISKFLVQGYDAGRFLNHISTANVDGPSNQITYTQWLNEKGFLEADLTVTKLSETEFLVVATDTICIIMFCNTWRVSRLARGHCNGRHVKIC
jgi:glycine cleavage system aminomethyltransferase T